jgi:hypothetical protein
MSEKKKKCEEKGKILNEKTGRCICHRNEKTGRCIEPEIPVGKRPVSKKKSNKSEKHRKCEEKGKLLNEKTGRCVCHRNEITGRCIEPEIPVKIKTPKTSPKSSVKAKTPKTSPKSPVKVKTPKSSVKVKTPKTPVKVKTPKKSKSPVKAADPDVIFGKGGVESLSGPVSFYYLRPKKSVYDLGHGQYFPLIVLFGDRHFSFENTCDPCVCSPKQKKGCCHKLSDPHFFRKLDRLSTPQHPVDFYTETPLSGTGSGFNGGMLKDLTTGEMISCYHHLLRGTRYDKCPTKKIRWQAGETRHIWSNELSVSYDEDHFMQELYKNPSNITKMERKTWIEQEFTTILRLFKSVKRVPKEFKHLYIIKIKLLLSKSVFNDIEGLQKLLLTLCDDSNGSGDLNVDKFSKAFFGLFTKDNSLIYKQILKQRFEPLRNFNRWIDFYKRLLHHETETQLYYIPYKKQVLREMIEKLPAILSNASAFDFSRFDPYDYLGGFDIINSPLSDIYTIARILKQPEGGNRSSLSFGYFGDAHVKNMVHLLLSTNLYELVYEKPMIHSISRCQTFDFTLNLSEEVRDHNRKIK